MSLSVSYDESTKPAVVVATTGLPQPAALTVTGIVQRSVDGDIRWTTVRALAEAPLTAGALVTTDDYEFRAAVANSYRAGLNQEVTDTFTRTEASDLGDADTGQAYAAPSGAGAVSVATGYGRMEFAAANTSALVYVDSGDMDDAGDMTVSAVLQVSDVATGAELGQDLFARVIDANNAYYARVKWDLLGVPRISLNKVVAGVGSVIGSEVAVPLTYAADTDYRLVFDLAGQRLRAVLWDAAVTPQPGWQIDETDDTFAAGIVGMQGFRATGNSNTSPQVRWGELVVDTGRPVFLYTDSVTPSLSRLWLESVMRSFLNQAPMVVGFSEISRAGRGDSTAVVGRSLAIAQTELASGRALSLTIRVPDLAAQRQLDFLLASGDVLFLQTPDGCKVPGGYFVVDGSSIRLVRPTGDPWLCSFDLLERAAPGPDVVTAHSTWATVIALYGTWADVVAANPTWDDVLELVGDPAEVIVP